MRTCEPGVTRPQRVEDEALKARLAAEAPDDPGPEQRAELALARYAAGFADAAVELEAAYLPLSSRTPHRGAMEAALTALGLL